MNKLNRVLVGTAVGWLACACGGTVDLQSAPDSAAGTSGAGSTANASNGGGGTGGGGGTDPTSSAGAPADAPTVEAACGQYCDAYVAVCPEAGHGTVIECTAACVDGLGNASAACVSGKVEAFECIAVALQQAPASCVDALEHAASECGSADADVPACNEQCLPQVHGGSGVGYAEATCGGHAVSLRCEDTVGSGTPCSCSIDGEQVFSLATGFSSSKAAVSDEPLFQLCLSKL